MFLNDDIDIVVCSYNYFYIDSIVSTDEGIWRFTDFYGEPELSKRKLSWDLLRRLHVNQNLPWPVAGDFNEILKNSEKVGGPDRPPWAIRQFQEALVIVTCVIWDIKATSLRGSTTENEMILPKFVWNLQYYFLKYLSKYYS